MNERVDSLYICPWSLADPLCQSQSLPYLRGLVGAGYKIALVTHEAPGHKLAPDKERDELQKLRKEGICWFPITYRSGASLANKLLDTGGVISAGLSIWRRHRPRLIHSRSSLPIAGALALSTLLRLPYLYDADSSLSEEYVDIGHWSRESKAYRLLSYFERLARRRSEEMIVLTHVLARLFSVDRDGKSPISVIPCCVDTGKFAFDPELRAQRRKELGLGDETLFTYVGKIGSWYLIDETFELFKEVIDQRPDSRLLIISGDGEASFREVADRTGVPQENVLFRRSTHDEMAGWLSASDVGFCLISQVSSKRGTSPIKFAEYLSTGLPVVISDKIGDCSAIIRAEGTGVVLNTSDRQSYYKASSEILALAGVSQDIRLKCRDVAKRYFDMKDVGVESYIDIYRRLLG